MSIEVLFFTNFRLMLHNIASTHTKKKKKGKRKKKMILKKYTVENLHIFSEGLVFNAVLTFQLEALVIIKMLCGII